MRTILATALQALIKPLLLLSNTAFFLLSFLLPSFLLPNMAMAHVGDHHGMDFFHGLAHFMGEHYPFILGPILIVACYWILQKSGSSKK